MSLFFKADRVGTLSRRQLATKSKVLRCAAALGAIALGGGLITATPVAATANNCQ